jgi:hypothetical protein
MNKRLGEGALTADDERRIQKPLISQSLQPGRFYYLISSKWLDSWKHYVDYNNYNRFFDRGYSKPESIDNQPLVDASETQDESKPVLKKDLLETTDYDLLCEEAWVSIPYRHCSSLI